MPKKFTDFIPKAQAARKAWYQFEIDNATEMGAAIGMTGPQITAYKAYCQDQINDIDAVILAKANLAAATKNVKTNSKVNDPAIREAVRLAKTNTTYTPGGGSNFKIVDTHTTVDYSDFTPELEFKVYMGYVRLKFDFHGLEMMNVYCRLKGTTDWVKVASVSHSPFDDHRPIFQPNPPPVAQLLSEAREYMIIGVMDDEEVGNTSAIISVVFGG